MRFTLLNQMIYTIVMRRIAVMIFLILTFSPTAYCKGKSPMIELKELMTLPVSAASGLLRIGEDFYTVSDDELKLYKITRHQKIESYQLIAGHLPNEHKERKKQKPDFESLYFDQNKVFAMPSLSKPNRVKAATFDVKSLDVEVKDLSKFYEKASQMVEDLNIEGSALVQNELWLFQRGNGEKGLNGILKVKPENMSIITFQKIDLGKMKNQNLGFTDVVLKGNHIYFLAVVETTKSTYDDGKYLGAMLGKMDLSGKILNTIEVKSEFKPEGLVIESNEIFIVTDADNREITSRLYKGMIPDNF